MKVTYIIFLGCSLCGKTANSGENKAMQGGKKGMDHSHSLWHLHTSTQLPGPQWKIKYTHLGPQWNMKYMHPGPQWNMKYMHPGPQWNMKYMHPDPQWNMKYMHLGPQ